MPGISPIYEELDGLQAKGHMKGRKLGVIQEIMVHKYINSIPVVAERTVYNMKPEGWSGAAHTIEFVLCSLMSRIDVIGGQKYKLGAVPIEIGAITDRSVRISVPDIGSVEVLKHRVALGQIGELLRELGFAVRVNSISETTAQQGMLSNSVKAANLSILDYTDVLVNIESKRVGVEETGGQLLAGPQTIEKAKQASLVAVDLDLKYNNTIKPFKKPGNSYKLISVVILGNGVHWEEKSIKVLKAFVDYVYIVKDEAVIRYLRYVMGQSGGQVDKGKYLYDYFSGTLTSPEDDFEVTNDDFELICPENDSRPLSQVLIEHITEVNPIK